ncbi:MAG: bifunctional DNA primase/polymerase [Phototrophicaceae bacterium]
MSLSNELHNFALKYRSLGLSTIPVWGNKYPEKAKLPAVKWSIFQRRLATVDEINGWYNQKHYRGLAVVCGNISKLLVLDFDDPTYVQHFVEAFPHLQNTRIVLSASRRLPHYYFRLGVGVPSQSYSFSGLDWQCDGKYVVAPPTQLGDSEWEVSSDSPILELDKTAYQHLLEFFRNLTQHRIGSSPYSLNGHSNQPHVPLSVELLQKHYFENLFWGRNNALYRTACLARQSGTPLAVAESLVPLHAHQQAFSNHHFETIQQRTAEAIRTIQSAYRSNFVSDICSSSSRSLGLPNQFRERLLQDKQSALLRVLECLKKSGWACGSLFNRKQLAELCNKFQVGDWSIRKALEATCPSGMNIFAPAKMGIPAISNCANAQYSLMREVRVTEPTKNRGRPEVYFQVPFWEDVFNRFGVTHKFSDNLADESLHKPKQYRLAFHVALIARRAGRYSRRWLAERLGITTRSLDRYYAEGVTGVTRIPMIKEKIITWWNIDQDLPILEIEDAKGVFLQDSDGKRYPPLKPIARRLLGMKQRITLCIQGFNQYYATSCGGNQIVDTQNTETTPCLLVEGNGLIPAQYPPIRKPIINDVRSGAVLSHKQLTNLEEETISQLLSISKGTLRYERAIQLLDQYGAFAIKDVCTTLIDRQSNKPVAYLIRLLEQRYGQDMDEVAQAESLYIAIQSYSSQSNVSWDVCVKLVKEYGIQKVRDVLNQLYDTSEQIRNISGWIITQLKHSSVNHSEQTCLFISDITQENVLVYINSKSRKLMSRKTIKNLIQTYTIEMLVKAINISTLHPNIDNLAGWVISYLRSETRLSKSLCSR